MSETQQRETTLRTRYGLRLLLPDEIYKPKPAKDWLEEVEDILGEAMTKQGVTLHALEIPTNQPGDIQVSLGPVDTLRRYQRARNLWIERTAGTIEIGTEVMLKSKEPMVVNGVTKFRKRSKGQKFVMSPQMARQLASHLVRLADELEGGGA